MWGEDGRSYLTIRQIRCDSVSVEWRTRSYDGSSRTAQVLPLDGKFRGDKAWFGSKEKWRSAAQFRSGALEIAVKPVSGRDTSRVSWSHRLELLPSKDLCVTYIDSRQRATGSLYARQKGPGKAAEEEAARRSSERCP
jgi:hypothetical protein